MGNRDSVSFLSAGDLKALLQRGQPGLHAAVIHITAHLDAHPPDQRRAVGERSRSAPGHTRVPDPAWMLACKSAGNGVALSTGGRVPGAVEFHQPPKLRKER